MLISAFETIHATDNEKISSDVRDEIIEVSKKGWYTYETIGGQAYDARFGLSDRNDCYKYVSDFFCYGKDTRYGHPELTGYFYEKTNFKTKEEVKEYVDKIFINNTFDVNEKFCEDVGHYKMVVVDNFIYLPTSEGRVTGSLEWDFDNAEIEIVDDKATVTLKVTKDYDLPEDYSETIELFKTGDEWKICGGTLFINEPNDYESGWYTSFYSVESPATGENTVLYISIAGAAVVAMLSLAVRKKKKIV